MKLARAAGALDAGDFAAAMVELADGDGDGTAPWLELKAMAAYGAGEYEGAVACWEQLHALHRAAGQHEQAARAAVMTAMFLLIDAGMLSTVRGWTRRGERLLGEGGLAGDSPVRALIAAVTAYERFFSGDLPAAAEHAATAITLGERLGVMPAVTIGRTAAGRVAILSGDVDGGIAQLEEVAAVLMSGEVDNLTAGMMFCELVCAAQGLLRHDLAREWTDAMATWGVAGAVGGIHGRCRVHQAELLRMSGPAEAAERAALEACDELRPWMRREYGWPLAELGLVRLRRGDLAGAEEAFAAVAEHAWPIHPGLALLRLEQDRADEAAQEIAAAIAHPVDAPSKELPPFGELRLVPLFDAQSEIAMAVADPTLAVTLADAAHEGLASAAQRFPSPMLLAVVDRADARRALLAGNFATAAALAGRAAGALAELDAPYEAGAARVVLAEACLGLDDEAAARAALLAARTEFLRYGAAHRVIAIDRRLASPRPVVVPQADGPAHRGTFRRGGPLWFVALGGAEAQVKDLKGLRYLHRLVSEPGREFHVLDMVAMESGTLRPAGPEASGLPALDETARAAYRRRLADIEEDIDEATRLHDLGRLARAEADRQYLVNELTRAVGIGQRSRVQGGASERARTAVARMLRYALDELERCHPPAARHFRASVRTGTYCSYRPDPLTRVEWEL